MGTSGVKRKSLSEADVKASTMIKVSKETFSEFGGGPTLIYIPSSADKAEVGGIE